MSHEDLRFFEPDFAEGEAPAVAKAAGAKAAGAKASAAKPDPSPESNEAAPSGPLRRVMLLVAYDGSAFRGFAEQRASEVPTVAGRLAAAVGRIAGEPVSLTCAGRTDAGVHASGQVVHFDHHLDAVGAGRLASPGARLSKSLSTQCGPAVAVLDARLAPTGFDARHSAVARSYRYLVLRSASPDPLLRDRSWHVPAALDLAAMRTASYCLLGEHDFSAFCRKPPDGGSLVRRVSSVNLVDQVGGDSRLWAVDITANAFCHQMVRSLVGALVSVGEGKATAASVLATLRSGDRSQGSRLAPPGGLCLMAVRYPEEFVPGGVWLPPT